MSILKVTGDEGWAAGPCPAASTAETIMPATLSDKTRINRPKDVDYPTLFRCRWVRLRVLNLPCSSHVNKDATSSLELSPGDGTRLRRPSVRAGSGASRRSR